MAYAWRALQIATLIGVIILFIVLMVLFFSMVQVITTTPADQLSVSTGDNTNEFADTVFDGNTITFTPNTTTSTIDVIDSTDDRVKRYSPQATHGEAVTVHLEEAGDYDLVQQDRNGNETAVMGVSASTTNTFISLENRFGLAGAFGVVIFLAFILSILSPLGEKCSEKIRKWQHK